MWFIFNLKKEFKKIKDSFNKSKQDIKKLKDEFVSRKEVDLMIREQILKVQSEPKSEPITEPKERKSFEAIMIKKAVKNRPELIKQGIRGYLQKRYTTTQMFNVIVKEKQLVGKTQFYHYLSLVKNEVRTELRPELRTKR